MDKGIRGGYPVFKDKPTPEFMECWNPILERMSEGELRDLHEQLAKNGGTHSTPNNTWLHDRTLYLQAKGEKSE